MAIIHFGERPLARNPWAEFERMRRDFENFTRLLSGETADYRKPTVYPTLNISEDKDNIYVKAEIPGVHSEDLEISIEGETLAIKGERKAPAEKEKVSYHRRELEYGKFNRSITLPTRVAIEKISARTENGILSICLPKAEEVKPRQITVTLS